MSAFFALSGFVNEKYSSTHTHIHTYEKLLQRIVNMAFPALVFGGIAFCTGLNLGKFSFVKAFKLARLWFIWTMIAVDIVHWFMSVILSKINYRGTMLFLIPLIAAIVFGAMGISNSICNTIGKAAGYLLIYELGGLLGRKVSEKAESRLLCIKSGIFLGVVSIVSISTCYWAFGGNVVLKALYRIPVGVLMSFALFCLFYKNSAFNFFAPAGKVTLQGYLLQVAFCAWIGTFTPAFPYWVDGIIFVVITCFWYFAPIVLDKRLGKSAPYSILFHPYSYFQRLHAERKHEKAGK